MPKEICIDRGLVHSSKMEREQALADISRIELDDRVLQLEVKRARLLLEEQVEPQQEPRELWTTGDVSRMRR